MKIRSRSSISGLAAMVLVAGLIFSGQTLAQDNKFEVTGSYTAYFTKLDWLGQGQGFNVFDVCVQGPFNLVIGDVPRTGTATFPNIARIFFDGSPIPIHGTAAWLFDDGTTCVGFMSGVVSVGGHGEFKCSDDTNLILDYESVVVNPFEYVVWEVKGKLLPGFGRLDD